MHDDPTGTATATAVSTATEVPTATEVSTATAYRTCPLCEALCGLKITVTDGRLTSVRGDDDHVLSRGFICPKGASFGQLVADPDRLRRPLVREGDRHVEVSWDEAFGAVDAGLRRVVAEHGRGAVAAYTGNPGAHTMSGALHQPALMKALGTRHLYTASTVDQMPKHVSSGYLFGHPSLIPVPDLDRTDYLLMLGANPAESNGSLCSAPDFPGRLKAIRARGGKVVVVDPRRTRTAALADTHLFIRPNTDAYLLFGIVHTLFAEDLVALGRLADHTVGVEDVAKLAREFTPESVADVCGVPAVTTRGLARELAAAPTAAVYGRLGTTTVSFGTLTSWLVDVVNVLTGNLDATGGAMFPLGATSAADGSRGGGRGFAFGRWASRVRGLPEAMGQLPVATLAEEIETPGDGQIHALVTVAGNPALSTPNAERLEAALRSLEFMVSVDPYLNETTRHADVILPPTDSARVGHFDFFLNSLAVRNVATYSPPVLPADPGGLTESDILVRLALVASGLGPASEADVAAAHEAQLEAMLRQAVGNPRSPVAGRDVAELRAMVTGDSPAERLLDVAVRIGAYGDAFGTEGPSGGGSDGLSLAKLLDNPHGVDLGALQPRVPYLLRTVSGKIELCPEPIAADVSRLREAAAAYGEGLVLIGRRHLRSNNSWMHNVEPLVKGRDRCTLLVHPDDAARFGTADGTLARVTSRAGSVEVAVEVTVDVMPGVASLPHGWGHGATGTQIDVANAHPGVNSNILTDEHDVDPLSGNAVLSGIPVTLAPA